MILFGVTAAILNPQFRIYFVAAFLTNKRRNPLYLDKYVVHNPNTIKRMHYM